MQDAEASRSETHLLLESKKQNTFASEIISNPQGFLGIGIQFFFN